MLTIGSEPVGVITFPEIRYNLAVTISCPPNVTIARLADGAPVTKSILAKLNSMRKERK